MDNPPRVTTFRLSDGEPTTIHVNRPLKFKIVFTRGTYVEGIIPPNSDFTVCNHGDIAEFSVTVDDESTGDLALVTPVDRASTDDRGGAT